jgi:hypothetical protein
MKRKLKMILLKREAVLLLIILKNIRIVQEYIHWSKDKRILINSQPLLHLLELILMKIKMHLIYLFKKLQVF